MRRALMFGTVVVGLAAVAAFAFTASGVKYDLDDVLAQTRAALGVRDGAGGVILSGDADMQGMPLKISFSWDDEGRFLFDARGKMTMAKGYDGEVTWSLDPNGRARTKSLGDGMLDRKLHWVIAGLWADPDVDLELKRNTRRSTQDLAAIDIQTPGTEFFGTMYIDTETWLPRRFEAKHAGSVLDLQLDDYRTTGGRAWPTHMLAYIADRLEIEAWFREFTEVEEFPPGHFAAREATVEKSWHREAGAELTVRRGFYSHLFVQPVVNGEKAGWFAFDTGASRTMVDREVVAKLRLTKLANSSSHGVGGPVNETLHQLDTFTIGGLTVRDLPVSSGRIGRLGLPAGETCAGLLGMDVLAHSVIVYDLANTRIRLYDPATYQLPEGQWAPMLDYNGKPTVRLRYEGHEGMFQIDTGAPATMLFSPFTTERQKLLNGRDTKDDWVRGIGGRVKSRAGQIEWVEWGGQRFHDIRAEFVIEDRGTLADKFRDGIVGTGLLKRYVVVFDQSGGRIAYLPNS